MKEYHCTCPCGMKWTELDSGQGFFDVVKFCPVCEQVWKEIERYNLDVEEIAHVLSVRTGHDINRPVLRQLLKCIRK